MRTIDMNDPEDRKYVLQQSAATIVCLAIDSGEGCLQVQVLGVHLNGLDMGDWIVTAEHIPSNELMN